ncbi:hypothetical protein SAMN04487944_12123 [Gracilibacillus ureilyticus]|uniref:Uncharacterized protein n=1 Tax=Gracilibacillus ureilyticus TaxID=531814 RepID=A0A1H9V3A3_9BACI|nr:hypothetical protein [Gracilibacillus ureilyticus]SES16195.1 hypothetical protein SAMN04487944_12123 [Gracilibacillus ureilyticus]
MNLKDMGHGDRILYILGMSLCGVIFFVIIVGVIVALFIPGNRPAQTEITDSSPNKAAKPKPEANSDGRRLKEKSQWHQKEVRDKGS